MFFEEIKISISNLYIFLLRGKLWIQTIANNKYVSMAIPWQFSIEVIIQCLIRSKWYRMVWWNIFMSCVTSISSYICDVLIAWINKIIYTPFYVSLGCKPQNAACCRSTVLLIWFSIENLSCHVQNNNVWIYCGLKTASCRQAYSRQAWKKAAGLYIVWPNSVWQSVNIS